jgi:hypothetical protein
MGSTLALLCYTYSGNKKKTLCHKHNVLAKPPSALYRREGTSKRFKQNNLRISSVVGQFQILSTLSFTRATLRQRKAGSNIVLLPLSPLLMMLFWGSLSWRQHLGGVPGSALEGITIFWRKGASCLKTLQSITDWGYFNFWLNASCKAAEMSDMVGYPRVPHTYDAVTASLPHTMINAVA